MKNTKLITLVAEALLLTQAVQAAQEVEQTEQEQSEVHAHAEIQAQAEPAETAPEQKETRDEELRKQIAISEVQIQKVTQLVQEALSRAQEGLVNDLEIEEIKQTLQKAIRNIGLDRRAFCYEKEPKDIRDSINKIESLEEALREKYDALEEELNKKIAPLIKPRMEKFKQLVEKARSRADEGHVSEQEQKEIRQALQQAIEIADQAIGAEILKIRDYSLGAKFMDLKVDISWILENIKAKKEFIFNETSLYPVRAEPIRIPLHETFSLRLRGAGCCSGRELGSPLISSDAIELTSTGPEDVYFPIQKEEEGLDRSFWRLTIGQGGVRTHNFNFKAIKKGTVSVFVPSYERYMSDEKRLENPAFGHLAQFIVEEPQIASPEQKAKQNMGTQDMESAPVPVKCTPLSTPIFN